MTSGRPDAPFEIMLFNSPATYVVDVTCEVVMRIEEKAIFAGVSFPWGGSLIAVARKQSPV